MVKTGKPVFVRECDGVRYCYRTKRARRKELTSSDYTYTIYRTKSELEKIRFEEDFWPE